MRLVPGATIGILGAGQLGRMLAMAAARLGLKSHVFAPDADAPAFDVAAAKTVAAYEDEAALARFAEAVDVVTYEFENVPIACAEFLSERRPLRPNARALALTQDRLPEKTFLQDIGLETAPFLAIEDAGALIRAVAALGRPLGFARAARLGQEQRTGLLLGRGLGAGRGVAVLLVLVVVEAQRALLLRLLAVLLVRVGVVPLHQPEVDGRLLHESGHARPSLFELTVNRSPVSAVTPPAGFGGAWK